MRLETAGHGAFENPDEETIKAELGRLNSGDNDFATLSDEAGFIQTAAGGSGFVLEHRDGSGYFGTRNEQIALQDVQDAFVLYLKRDGSWKSKFDWVPRDTASSGETATQDRQPGMADSASDNPLDSLAGTLKNEAMRFARKKLGRLFRR